MFDVNASSHETNSQRRLQAGGRLRFVNAKLMFFLKKMQ